MNQDRCRGQTKEGKQCESPFVDKDGYCPAHGPDGTQRDAGQGPKGWRRDEAALQWRGIVCRSLGFARDDFGCPTLVQIDCPSGGRAGVELFGGAVDDLLDPGVGEGGGRARG